MVLVQAGEGAEVDHRNNVALREGTRLCRRRITGSDFH